MDDVILDFETFYDSEYSLDKMENAEYVMDPRFEVIGVSIKRPGQQTTWHTGDHAEISRVLGQIGWANKRLVSHNARFDGSVLEWRFGFKPQAYLCTMVGSRPHFVPYCKSQGLANIAAYLGVGVKGDYVHAVKGMHRADFDDLQIASYGVYCTNDSDLSDGIRIKLLEVMPPEELDVIDATIKKYLRPTLLLDRGALVARLQSLDAERKEREQKLRDVNLTIKDITSRNKFAEHLKTALSGTAVVPMKTNKAGKLTYAFAKDDVDFKAMLAHPDPRVRFLVESKIALSSTMERGRVEKLIQLHDQMDGKLPVPLVYYGAHTGRLSGDHGINLQNLPRVQWNDDKDHSKGLKKGHLRFALKAPAGYSVVAADLSNIEARIVAALSGQADLITAFRNGFDVYSDFASDIYGIKINKKDHPLQRFVGKTCILGLGYGMGWKKFRMKMAAEGIVLTEQEAKRIVDLYRSKYYKIPELWQHMEYCAIQHMTKPNGLRSTRGGLTFAHERIILPNGMPIIYPGLRAGPRGIKFDHRYAASEAQQAVKEQTGESSWEGMASIWGGAFTENVAQALARIILTNAEMTLARAGIRSCLQVHDELVFLIPTQLVDKVIPVIEKVLTRPVDWLPDLPIACEIGYGPTYGSAK